MSTGKHLVTSAGPVCAGAWAAARRAALGLLLVTAATQAETQTSRPAVEVKARLGRPVVHVNGTPLALPAYSPVGWSRPHYQTAVPRFAGHRMGMYFLNRPFAAGDGWAASYHWRGDAISRTPLVEPSPGDSPSYEEQVDFIRRHDPDAWFFIREVAASAPDSWLRLHADQCFVTEEGQALSPAVPSLGSELFWDALARAARASIEHVEEQPWADRVLGYWCGFFGEGTYAPLYQYWLYDHSAVMTARWRAFLREKYATVEALRAAHHDPEATFETIPVPRDPLLARQREVAAQLYWQPAAVNQPRRDYLELTAQLLRDGYARVMHACAQATGGRKLCVYDAFKLPMQGWNLLGFFDVGQSWWPAYPEMLSGGGYLGMASLFETPGFDGLITPHDYQARGMGGVYQPEGLADSMVLRGKLFLSEMDLRTYQNPPLDYGAARNVNEYAALSWRNLADSLTRGYHSYWMDLCGNHDGWFGNDDIHAVIARQVEVLREALDWPHADVPGIAMILDDRAVLETNGAGNYFNEAVMWETKMGLARCGVPFRIYLFEDLRLAAFPPHRVFYFPNLFRGDDERLNLLREKVMRDGNVVVWGPGSGISDGTGLSVESAARLTGFAFEPLLAANLPRRTLVSDFAHPITKGLKADTILGGPLAYGPALYPKDGTALGVAWTKQGRNYTGLAVKEFGRGARGTHSGQGEPGPGDWTSVFTTAIPLPADLWRNLARYAGAHVYCESNDVLMADGTIVALHSLQPGRKTILLPEERRVFDVVTGRRIARRATSIAFTLDAPGTRVFRLEPTGR
ncbi:MAG: hypothetical protein BWZ02_00312 [Lentisphaerae bacterium ADurb.BinA184]|nr:MAG: hypothetical protein BWZ02_00312 [Lentisphaerae bacterium ADurb.BinA184]